MQAQQQPTQQEFDSAWWYTVVLSTLLGALTCFLFLYLEFGDEFINLFRGL